MASLRSPHPAGTIDPASNTDPAWMACAARIAWLSLPLLLCTLVAGCGADAPTEGETTSSGVAADPVAADTQPPATESEPESVADSVADSAPAAETGQLTGVVTFTGEIPEPRLVQATKDQEFCAVGAGSVQDVQVQDGRLAGAVIELQIRGADLPEFFTPEDGFVLRQKDCLFTPRLLVAFDGAELTVYNDDKVEHNVNTGSWNLLQSPGGQAIQQKIAYQGTPFARVTCNIHSWMESWVYVARSPYYAVTGADGTFSLTDVPAGKVRGIVSHATLGRKRFTADIQAGEISNIDFEYPLK